MPNTTLGGKNTQSGRCIGSTTSGHRPGGPYRREQLSAEWRRRNRWGIERCMPTHSGLSNGIGSFSFTFGTSEEQNPYSGELAAVGTALGTLPELRFCSVMLTTRNKAEALALQKPRQQSGQQYIRRIYKSVRALRRYGNTVAVCWLPSSEEHELMKLAKEKAKAVKRQGCTPQDATP